MRTKILIIEDEPTIVDNIVYVLQDEGFDPCWASDGRLGLQLLEREAPALVLLDIGLPDCNGFELLKEIRDRSDVPVIVLTARAAELDRVVGLEIGADDYVTKPFSPRELSARVRAVLRRARPAAVSHGDSSAAPPLPLTIDESRCTVIYFGRPLQLSRYEFKLLAVLVKRPGWVFSREQLMEMVWDEPESAMDRTVDTHIKTIRAKLREIRPDLDPIITHRGLGYSLREDW